MGEGNIIKHTSEDGKITYRENASAGLSGLREGEEWVEAKDINTIYVLVDNNSHNTVAGVGRIAYGNQYDEFIVEKENGKIITLGNELKLLESILEMGEKDIVFTEEEKLELLSSVQAFQALTGSKSSSVSKLKSFTGANGDWIEIDFGPQRR